MELATVVAGLLGLGAKLFRLHSDLVYLQGQLNGAVATAVILLGLYLITRRPTPRS